VQAKERDLISAQALLRQKLKKPLPLSRRAPPSISDGSMEEGESIVNGDEKAVDKKRDHAVSADALLDALTLYSEM